MLFFIRRDRRSSGRFLRLRLTLFFLAAGIWLAGVRIEREWVTAAGILVLFVAVLLGLVQRRDGR